MKWLAEPDYYMCNTQASREYIIIKAITAAIVEIMTDCLGSALPELRTTLVQINTPIPTARTTAMKNDDIPYIKSECKSLSNVG